MDNNENVKNKTENGNIIEKNSNKVEEKTTKITFLRLVQYFIIYSFIGLILETLFGLIVEGVIESRRNFLYSPFSCIYGLGAVIMILSLQRFSKNRYALFLGGLLIGSALEYGMSLIGELIYNVKWWDYSDIPFNINGRICLLFSIMWGLLAVYFISYFNPKVERLLNRINIKFLNISTIVIMIFMIIDFLLTSFALNVFITRAVNNFDIELKDTAQILVKYDEWCENETFKNVTDTVFSDKKILKTFPNLRITLKNNKIVYARELFPDIQPYYFRVFEVVVNFPNIDSMNSYR